ncbi:MAG: ABC transporter [Melioribacteraceae bacterium]|nr:MAG: ABC transporter [Melioribacteraceae bacterium]
MQIFESIKMAFGSLVSNKLRSVLTLLGISIGLFSIIVVMTALGAIQQSFEDVFNSIGSNNFIIRKFPAIHTPGSWRKYRNRPDLTVDQALKLKEMASLPGAVGLQLVRGGQTVKFDGESTNPDVTVIGANLDYMLIDALTVESGRGLSGQDVELSRAVTVIGIDVANKLFPNVDPIGQEIKIDNLSIRVIGVYEKLGSMLGAGRDNFLVIPYTIFLKKYGGDRDANITVMATEKSQLSETMDQVISILRILRKVEPGEDNNFEIITNDQLITQFNDITKYFRYGAGIVAFIALVAAGVGIMNIMLVSVTERTKEIGIRKAIGAKKQIIRTQFLVEAIVLCQIGGVIGIILGVLSGNLVALILGVSVILPVDWILIGLTVTTLVGVIFGVYPAVKASNLDPIDALRYE